MSKFIFLFFILLTLATQAGEMKFLWSVPTPDKNVFMLRFINNDEEFVAGSNVDLAVHNSETGELIRRLTELDASKFELMKGGQTALVLSGARLVKVDLNEMNIIQEETLPTVKDGWEIQYKNIAVDNDRNNIYLNLEYQFNDAGNYSYYHEIRVYDAESLTEKFELTTENQHNNYFYIFAISPDNRYFASVSEGHSRLFVWETETNKLVVDYELVPQTTLEWGYPADIEFSLDNANIILLTGRFKQSASDENHQGIKIFDIEKNEIINSAFDQYDSQLGWSTVAFFKNENYILNTSREIVKILDIMENKIVFSALNSDNYIWSDPIITKSDNLIIGASQLSLSAGKYSFDSSIVENLEETILYPNPTTNQVFLPCEYFIPRENIKVFDKGGREVTYLVQINTNEEGITVILDKLAKGMYILQIVYADTAISYKLIKGE